MAETADDLSTPLGQKTVRRKRRFRLPFTGIQALAVVLGLFLVAFVGFAIFNDNPFGGEPIARVALRQAAPAGDKSAAAASSAAEPAMKSAPKQAPAGEQKTVTIIDGSSGARHDVVIGGDAADKAEPDAAPAMMAGIDQRLLEKSRYGMIPVVSDGLKPFTVYAAEADRAKAAKMPVVAIVVGGLGVGAAKTTDAIMKLPAAVTLAFTPYGSDPAKLAERARAQRHEILLQIPMEPFDYPDNDPGPQTLLTTLGARAESRPAVLASQPVPGLCRDRQFHGRALRRHRRGDAADRARGRQARARLSRRRLGAAQRRRLIGGRPGDAVRQGRSQHRCGADGGWKSTGRSQSSKVWRRNAEPRSASPRRCRFRSSGSASGSRRSKAMASCLCH